MLSKINHLQYGEWCMLVKLCIHDEQVNPNELQRFHPFFNQLSITSVKAILSISKLTQLMCDTILYSQGDTDDKIYLVLTGILFLHQKEQGAVGVVTYENTLGEEILQGAPKMEFAVAIQPCYLLEFSQADLKSLRQKWMDRKDAMKLEKLIQTNMRQKSHWRSIILK